MGTRSVRTGMLLCIAVGMAGCATNSPPPGNGLQANGQLRRRESIEVMPVAAQTMRLDADRRCLLTFCSKLRGLVSDMSALRNDVTAAGRDHFTADENERIESLLFRYRICRQSLWHMVDFYADYDVRFSSTERQTKAFLIGFNAAVHLADCSSDFILTFLDNARFTGKLNEAHYRSGVPSGTYDGVFRAVTSIDHLARLKAAWFLFSTEMTAPRSELRQLMISDPAYRERIDDICTCHARADERIQEILRRRSLLLPDVANRLRHTAIADFARRAREETESNLAAAQAVLYLNVSRLKDPFSKVTSYSPDQVAAIRGELQPGDLILTYSVGYMSNVFLPGVFKHGITYVGSPRQRHKAGMAAYEPLRSGDDAAEQLRERVEQGKLASGQRAELIEAVAEGVVLNSLDTILDGHVSRLVVLRPHLSGADRVLALGALFEYLGDNYDFDFDFSDASAQCCTELIYRTLHARGRLAFPLVRRFGRPTLAADDIILSYLRTPVPAFSFILLAEQDPHAANGSARVLTGATGEQRLRALMSDAHALTGAAEDR